MAKSKAGASDGSKERQPEKPLSLKQLADHLGLAPATVSLVLNGSLVANTIAAETKAQIFAAAKKFNYRPNFFARCLRTRRSFTIGVMVPEVSAGYNATVMSGIEDHLLKKGYFYFVASHRFLPDLIDEYPKLFMDRSVDGLIVVNTPWHQSLPVPVVSISSHDMLSGVTAIVIDHNHAAEVALKHLIELGHQKIAFIKGPECIPDTEVRWNAIVKVAERMRLPIHPKLVVQLEENLQSPEPGYKITQKLLTNDRSFTALFAFNDLCAIGAIRALHEAGLNVPEDISVVGFDDIESAEYQSPGLTTVRQPLRKMGMMAAQTLLRRITHSEEETNSAPRQIIIEPELVVRGTTSMVSHREWTKQIEKELTA